MSSFALYTIGFIVLITGLSFASAMVGIPPQWIGVGAIILSGIGLISAVSHTRKKDETEASQ